MTPDEFATDMSQGNLGNPSPSTMKEEASQSVEVSDSSAFDQSLRIRHPRWWPVFADRVAEERFVSEYNIEGLQSFRAWLGLATIVWIAFAAVDLTLPGPRRTHLLLFRLGIVTPALLIIFGVSFARLAAARYQTIAVVSLFVVQGALVYAVSQYDLEAVAESFHLNLPLRPDDASFLFAIVWLLVISAMIGLARLLTVPWVIATTLFAGWTAVAVAIHKPSWIVLASVIPFFLASIASGWLGSVLLQNYARRDFRAKQLLKRERSLLAQAHADLRRHADRIHDDLALAAMVQAKLVPDRLQMPLHGRMAWASKFIPAAEVGGDYFDVAEFADGRAAIIFADASGHGMAAALVTMILKMTFESCVENQAPLEEFVQEANRALCRLTPEGAFVVLIAACYDPKEQRLDYVNCGHTPEPILVPGHPSQPIEGLNQVGAMLLGVQESIEVQAFSRRLTRGDRILMVTDGLTEAKGLDGEFYDRWRLDAFLQEHRSFGLTELVDALMGEITAFSGQAEPNDDRAVLMFEVR